MDFDGPLADSTTVVYVKFFADSYHYIKTFFIVLIIVVDVIIVENLCCSFPLRSCLQGQFLVGLPVGVVSASLISGLVIRLALASGIRMEMTYPISEYKL